MVYNYFNGTKNYSHEMYYFSLILDVASVNDAKVTDPVIRNK